MKVTVNRPYNWDREAYLFKRRSEITASIFWSVYFFCAVAMAALVIFGWLKT